MIGIIGYGMFGKFMASHLAKHFTVSVTDTEEKETEENITFTSLEETCNQDIIILAVPMENLASVLESIKDKVRPGTLVMDICSLKSHIIRNFTEKLL